MKTRSGFVSNSSSTSFTCDICGEEVSGMDLGMREAGMCLCRNGHTFCENHQRGGVEELTLEEKRQVLINKWKNYPKSGWLTDEERAELIKKEEDKSEDEIEDAYHDFESDEGINPEFCPICMFEKPYDKDLFKLLLKKYELSVESVLVEAKQEFGTYEKFQEYLQTK